MSTQNPNSLDFTVKKTTIFPYLLGNTSNEFDFLYKSNIYNYPTDRQENIVISGSAYIYGDASISNFVYQNISGNAYLLDPLKSGYIYGNAFIQTNILRPIYDIESGNWLSGNLYSKINEVSPDDSNYIHSSASPSDDSCILKLTNTGTPINRDNHVIRYRIQKSRETSSQLNLTATLYENSTPIASGVHNDINYGFYVTGFSLTNQEASSISNYSNLRIKFTASTSYGSKLIDENGNLFIDENANNLVENND